MKNYKFRVIMPHPTEWVEVVAASFGEAIQQWHYDNAKGFDISIKVNSEVQSFALFESDTGEQLISRVCSMGITRKGGVQPRGRAATLEYVAKALGVTLEALQGPWELEEQYP